MTNFATAERNFNSPFFNRSDEMGERKSACSGLPTAVDECLGHYFSSLGAMAPAPGLYDAIVTQVEKPLIEHVLRHARGNQLRAAQILGINRNTLRKKIQNLGVDVNSCSRRH